MCDLGLSISYDRVVEISTAMGNCVCEQYHRDAAVCPPNLRQDSRQQQSIIIPILPLPPVHFMELEYHLSSIQKSIVVDLIAENITYLSEKDMQQESVRASTVVHQCVPIRASKERSTNP